MVKPSSETLHPSSGARFALTRIGTPHPDDAQQALSYEVVVYDAQGQTLRGTLSLPAQGKATLEGVPTEHWAHQETLKLGRVLKKSRVASLLRWRAGPEG